LKINPQKKNFENFIQDDEKNGFLSNTGSRKIRPKGDRFQYFGMKNGLFNSQNKK
jgi:hypothetical protein